MVTGCPSVITFSTTKCQYTCSPPYYKFGSSCNSPPDISALSLQAGSECKIGNEITVQCTASDADDALALADGSITLKVGTTPITPVSGSFAISDGASGSKTYSARYKVTQAAGTALDAACRVAKNGKEDVQDQKPLCSVEACPTSPTFEGITLDPAVPKPGNALQITFTASRPLPAGKDPVVEIITPSGQVIRLTKIARSGLNYIYQTTISSSYGLGDALVSVTGEDASNTLCIGKTEKPFLILADPSAPQPDSLAITANPPVIDADGSSKSVITATFMAGGKLLPFQSTIKFTSDKGAFEPGKNACVTSPDKSSCSVNLVASANEETAIVTAKWDGLSANIQVQFSKTPVPDVTAPNIFNPRPRGPLIITPPATTTSATLLAETDEAATCRYSTTDQSYDQMVSTTTPRGISHSWSLSGLTAGTQRFFIKCSDVFNNVNNGAFEHSFDVQTSPARFTLTAPHQPQNPLTTDTVVITATVSDTTNLDKIEIHVDNAKAKTCLKADYQAQNKCEYPQKYSEGTHNYYAIGYDTNRATTPIIIQSFTVKLPPRAVMQRTVSSCRNGDTITVKCDALNRNADEIDKIKFWAGQCGVSTAADPVKCFNDRSWEKADGQFYFNGYDASRGNGDTMELESGTTYKKAVIISQPVGTGVVATCKVVDKNGAESLDNAESDAYPLCIVGETEDDDCTDPVWFSNILVEPDPAPLGMIKIRF
ncbi:MAG: hypothetical protein QMD85_03310, partial [Candidatus Aenigmarchaeota archaeon]|nr:hypothetical protein [Candidatus Aenigmarchaeota archaeon]